MKQKLIIITIIYAILFMWLLPSQANSEVELTNTKYEQPKLIHIELTGAVVYPGSYTFYNEITISELVYYASGLTIEADLNLIKFNDVISKSSNIHIKEKIDLSDSNINTNFKVNINEASFMQLLTIPNITEKRAAQIIIYREANGPFTTIEQLINVKGIGSATFINISDFVTTK